MTEEIKNTQNEVPKQTVIINQTTKTGNSVGTAGFILAILGLFLGWVPVLGWILWILGAILSLVGVFKTPKGLAIAGLIISFIGVIMLIFLGGVIAAAMAM